MHGEVRGLVRCLPLDGLRVLVTGGAGFIGSNLVKRLLERGYQVIVLDNLSTGSLENIRAFLGDVEFIKGDVRSFDDIASAAKKADVVVHLAALINVAESLEKPDPYFEVNVTGTYNVAKASKNADTVIFASSSAVYGDPEKIPISEEHPLKPKSPYAASKVAGEAFINSFSSIYGYRPVIFRLFNVYGPKQSRGYAGVIVEFIRRALAGQPLVIFGSGEQIRDFIHVDDVTSAIVGAIASGRATGVYNIGSGEGVSINQLAELVIKLTGVEGLSVKYLPPMPGDINVSISDITKAKRGLGFEPKVELEDGLRGLIHYYKNLIGLNEEPH